MKMNKRNVTLVTAVCVLIFSVAGCAQPWIRDWLEPKLEEKRSKNAPPTPSASLSAIDLSAGTMTAAFDPDITNYIVEVPYGTANVTVAGHTNDSGGYVTYSPSPTVMLPSEQGAPSPIVTLRAAAPGKSARTYTISFTIGNQLQSYLTGLTPSVGALTDASGAGLDFDRDTLVYYVTVPSGAPSLTVTAQTAPLATVRYKQNSGAEGNNITNTMYMTLQGTEKLFITVNDGAGYSDKQYTVNVRISTDANTALLSDLTPAPGALYWADGSGYTGFNTNISSYRLVVSKDDTSTTVVATAPDVNYTAALVSPVSSGYADTNSALDVCSVTVAFPKPSSPPLQILVTRTGYTSTLYTIYFDYATGDKKDALLSSLGLSESTSFTPAFDPRVFRYEASVTGSMKPLIIMATHAESGCVVTYNPANYLTNPNDGMEIAVTCSGGPDYNSITYTIKLTVTADSSSNNLMALEINGKPILSIEDTMQPSYTDIGMPDGEFVIAATIPASASIAYMGAAPVGGTTNARVAALAAGVPRTVVILVTAQNGSVKAYSLTFYWAGSADNALTRVDFTTTVSETDAAAYGWLNKANNMQAKTVYNISTTESAVTVRNIAAASDTAIIKWSTTGVPGLALYTNGATIDISGLLEDGTAKTLLISVEPAAGATAFYTFNVRKYKTSYPFNYLAAAQAFTMPVPGKITFELWGAAGGNVYNTAQTGYGGGGGYRKATTNVSVVAGTKFYVYTGQKGNNTSTTAGTAAVYGGGGSGGSGAVRGGASGGGATFVSTFSNNAGITNGDVRNGRVLVAGGGGGGGGSGASDNARGGGHGSGGTIAGDGFGTGYGANATRGTTTGIGQNGRNGLASYGGGCINGAGGGGGGYFGGLANTVAGVGSGNSSGGGGNGWSKDGYTADVVALNGAWSDNGKATIIVTPDMP